jgi:chromosome segregation ATPase
LLQNLFISPPYTLFAKSSKIKMKVQKMDERKRIIRDMEDKRNEALASLDKGIEALGELLLSRGSTGAALGIAVEGEALEGEYQRLLEDEAANDAEIRKIDADLEKVKSLDGEIKGRDDEYAAASSQVPALHAKLGEMAMADPQYDALREPYKEQLDVLLPKIRSLEERLGDLEGRDKANVLTWIGKNAQGMVIRSFLGKNQSNLQRIYTAIGERFDLDAAAYGELDPDMQALMDGIRDIKKRSSGIRVEAAQLRDDRKRVMDSYTPDGGPQKKTAALQKANSDLKAERSKVSLEYGRKLEAAAESPEGAAKVEAVEGAAEIRRKIAETRATAADYARQTEKLQSAIAIDEEQEKVRQMEKGISELQARIEAARTEIANYTDGIEKAKAHIEELRQKL